MRYPVLIAYKNGVPQARFTVINLHNASIEYAPGVQLPLSLSLPLGYRNNNTKKPMAWLMNLLPTNDKVLNALRKEYGVVSTLSLLMKMGHDLPGAYSIIPEGENVPSQSEEDNRLVSEAEIYDAIARVKQEKFENPLIFGKHLSISGFQRKFVLSRTGNGWYRSSYFRPSTHIFKPASPTRTDDDILEQATQMLAKSLGLEVAESTIYRIGNLQTFVSTRFDRQNGMRLHMEDLNQVVGNSLHSNYQTPNWRELFQLLADNNVNYWPLVQQIIFNCTVGNTDAHLKNYSILETPSGYRVSPLYDSMALLGDKDLSTSLSLQIGSARNPYQLSKMVWSKWAEKAGIAPEPVVAEVERIKQGIAENGPTIFRKHTVADHHIYAMLEASKNIK